MLDWTEVAKLKPLRINFGSRNDCRGNRGGSMYDEYVGVGRHVRGTWAVQHVFPELLPLKDNSVDRALTEDMLEHLSNHTLAVALAEICRVIVPGGLFRIGVPDAGHPEYDEKARPQASPLRSPRYHWQHFTLETLSAAIFNAGFSWLNPLLWWDKYKTFHNRGIDYHLGWVKRTPENRFLYHHNWHGKGAIDLWSVSPSSLVVDAYK